MSIREKARSARVAGALIKNSGSTVLIVESDPTANGSRRDIADGGGFVTGVTLCAEEEDVPTKSLMRIGARAITLS